jgi:hypothetical protein
VRRCPGTLLSAHGPAERTYPSEEAMLQAFADTGAFNERLQRDGHFVFAGGLEPATTATTVNGQGEKPAFTDGLSWRRRSASADSASSRRPTSTWHWRSPPRGRKRAAARSRCDPSEPRNPYEGGQSRDRSHRRAGDHPCPPRGVGAGGRRPRAPFRRPRRRRGSDGRGVRSGCRAAVRSREARHTERDGGWRNRRPIVPR